MDYKSSHGMTTFVFHSPSWEVCTLRMDSGIYVDVTIHRAVKTSIVAGLLSKMCSVKCEAKQLIAGRLDGWGGG